MTQFNVGDIISFPSMKDVRLDVKQNIVVVPAKLSQRKTITIKRFLWFKDIAISFNRPSKKTVIPIATFKRH